jgi:hypothetical protein
MSSLSEYQNLSTPAARRHYREVTFQDDSLMEHSFRGLGNSNNKSYEFDVTWIHPSSGNGSKFYITKNDIVVQEGVDDEIDYEEEEPSDIPWQLTPLRALWNEQASALQVQMQNLGLCTNNTGGGLRRYDSDSDRVWLTLSSERARIFTLAI